MTVLAVNPTHRTNAERVVDLAALGYLPEPVLDPTYGLGGMWRKYRPEQLVTGDLHPDKGDLTFDFRCLPFPDGTFGSVLFDPPYRLAGTATNQGGMDDRYGIDRYRGVGETFDLILSGTREAARVTRRGGYVIVKCQSQVAGGRVRWQTYSLVREIEDMALVDELHLMSMREQPGNRAQQHARRNLSTFLVFRRTA